MKTLIKHYFIITLSNTAMTKYQRLGGLNNRNALPLQLWRLEVQDQGVSRLGEAPPWLIEHILLSLSSLDLSSV